MIKNPVSIWIALVDPSNELAVAIYFLGWVSTLLSVGYYSTPDNSVYGKIAFSAVVVIIAGIVMKTLHWSGGNLFIVAGLLGIIATYATRWVREKRYSKNHIFFIL